MLSKQPVGKTFLKDKEKNCFVFFCFTNQISLKPILTAELNCSCQSKDSLLERKFECKKEDKIIELSEGLNP